MLFRGTVKLPHQAQITRRDFTAETIARHWGARLSAYWLPADRVAANRARGTGYAAIYIDGPEFYSSLATRAFDTRDDLAAWCRAYGAKTDRVPREGENFTVVLPAGEEHMMPLADDGIPYPQAQPPTPDERVRELVNRALRQGGHTRTETPRPRALENGRTPGFLVSGGVDAITVSHHPFPADDDTLEEWYWTLILKRWSVRRGPNRTLTVTGGRYGWLGPDEFLGPLVPMDAPEQPPAPAYEYFGRRDGQEIRHEISQAELAEAMNRYLTSGSLERAPGGVYVAQYQDNPRYGFYPRARATRPLCSRCRRFKHEHLPWDDCPEFVNPS